MTNTGGTSETVENRLTPWKMVRLNHIFQNFQNDVAEFDSRAEEAYQALEGFTVAEASDEFIMLESMLVDLQSDLRVIRDTFFSPFFR